MKEETLIVTKTGWKVIREFVNSESRIHYGLAPKHYSDEELEEIWSRIKLKNGGASSKDYPISNDEYRYAKSDFGYTIETIKAILDSRGLTYRQDGFFREYS